MEGRGPFSQPKSSPPIMAAPSIKFFWVLPHKYFVPNPLPSCSKFFCPLCTHLNGNLARSWNFKLFCLWHTHSLTHSLILTRPREAFAPKNQFAPAHGYRPYIIGSHHFQFFSSSFHCFFVLDWLTLFPRGGYLIPPPNGNDYCVST